MEGNWFGVNGEICFRRVGVGRVQIGRRDGQSIQVLAEIEAGSWCSAVAHVSVHGESGLTWEIAKALHMGGTVIE